MTATGGRPPGPLAGWPHEVPSEVAQALVDMRLVQALEHGPATQWQAWQEQRLAALLQWLRASARWRDWLAPWPAGGGLGRLQALPVMRRADYRSFIEQEPVRVPAGFGGIGHTETSGSSGQPVRFAFSALARRLNVHTFAADDVRQGRDPRADTLVVTVQAQPPAGEHRVVEGDPWLHPGRRLIRHSGGYSVEDNARWLCRQQGAHLVTYPALLSGMLGAIQRHGLRPPRLQQVITFAETVDPALREQTRRILGARITDRYSCEEIGPIAFQCPASDHHHHVAVSNTIVEVVDEGGHPLPHGQEGSVLVTGLHQWASPAIRYELGDIATLLPHCPVCGVQVPTLTRLLGRRRVLVERASGELVYVRVQAAHWLEAAPGVHEWRMVQTAPRAFDVEVATAQPLTADEQAAVQAMLASRIGPEFTFSLREVARVNWPPGRKKQEIVTLG